MATQNVILLILAEVLMMAISGCGGGEGPVVVPPKLTAHVSTEKATFGRGERIPIRLEVKNSSSSSSSFSLNGETAIKVAVMQNGSAVFTSLIACLLALAEFCPPGPTTLAAGESLQYTAHWSQQEVKSGAPVSPGNYQIQAFVTEIDGNTQRMIASNVVTVEITP